MYVCTFEISTDIYDFENLLNAWDWQRVQQTNVSKPVNAQKSWPKHMWKHRLNEMDNKCWNYRKIEPNEAARQCICKDCRIYLIVMKIPLGCKVTTWNEL